MGSYPHRCIFCLRDKHSGFSVFRTTEHIVPESLGGGEWSELRQRRVCDQCQNYFGAKVEGAVLGDYPFNHFRTFNTLRTKKGKMPFFIDRMEGEFRAEQDGTLSYTPPDFFLGALLSGRKTQSCLLAETSHPQRVCQFLLKMGLELLSEDLGVEIYGQEYEPARRVARFLDAAYEWFYVYRNDPLLRAKQGLVGLSRNEDSPIELSIANQCGHPFVVLEMQEHSFIAPLTSHFRVDAEGYASSHARAYVVRGQQVRCIR